MVNFYLFSFTYRPNSAEHFFTEKRHTFFIKVCAQYETFICPTSPGTARVYQQTYFLFEKIYKIAFSKWLKCFQTNTKSVAICHGEKGT